VAKDITAAVIRSNKAKAFFVAKPLNFTCCHENQLSCNLRLADPKPIQKFRALARAALGWF
jgi:hypothetical protein